MAESLPEHPALSSSTVDGLPETAPMTVVPAVSPADVPQMPGARTEVAPTGQAGGERVLTWGYRAGFLLTSMVAGLTSVCLKQLLLPIQVGQLDPRTTNTSFALVAALGALAGLIAAPLTGALSDRTISRWGRRRPWLLAGILVGVGGLLVMATARSIPWLLVGEILEQIGVDAVLANVTALIPDQVPDAQQANTAALNGMAPVVGGVVGLTLVSFLTDPHQIMQGYLVLAVLSLVFVGLFLAVLRERPPTRADVPPFRLGAFLASFGHPLTSRDFVFTLLSRLMVFFTFTLLGSYLFFSLHVGLHTPVASAARTVTTFQLISTGALVIVALLAGVLSRRMQRLKPFVIGGAVFMALGIGLFVVVPTWAAFWSGAAIFGVGLGSYLGVDIALAVRVLPRADARGKDLGIISTSIFLPLILTPLTGAFILNHFQENFALLFSLAIVASLLAALLILPIRSVR